MTERTTDINNNKKCPISCQHNSIPIDQKEKNHDEGIYSQKYFRCSGLKKEDTGLFIYGQVAGITEITGVQRQNRRF